MSKNYKYYYTTHNLPTRGSVSGVEYENEYNQDYESEEYYGPIHDPQLCKPTGRTETTAENVPKPKILPATESTQSVPKTPSKLPYCIVPVLYVPKRIVQKEEIARNRVLQNSLASLSRMENLFYKYRANCDNDAAKQTTQEVDSSPYQKSNVQDYSVPNAYMDNSYYDSQYEYCTSNTDYEHDYISNYRQQQIPESFPENYKSVTAQPNVLTATPNYNYSYSYEREIDPTTAFSNQRSNPNITDTTRFDKQHNDMHQYTREDWLACQRRRLQNNLQMQHNMAGTSNSFSRNLKNNHTNTTIKLARAHSVGINAITEQENKTSQTLQFAPGYGERRSIFCEVYTQTDPQNYVTSITHRLRCPSQHRETKADFCEGPNEAVHVNPTRSATMIPKLIPTLTSCNTMESTKSCLHERNSCDSRQRSSCHKPLRSVSPEAARKFWK